MKKLRSIITGLCKGTTSVSAVLASVCTFVAVINVIMRYVFKRPITWAEEICVLTMVWMVFTSFPKLEKNNEHLNMTALYNMFPPKLKVVINVFRSIVTVLIGALIAYGGYVIVIRNMQIKTTTPTLRIPNALVYAIIPIVFVIVIIVRLVDLTITKNVDLATPDTSQIDVQSDGGICESEGIEK